MHHSCLEQSEGHHGGSQATCWYPHGAKLGGEPCSPHRSDRLAAEAQGEDAILPWLQRTLRWGCLSLHCPGLSFHAIRAPTPPVLGMGKLMLQPYLLSARTVQFVCCFAYIRMLSPYLNSKNVKIGISRRVNTPLCCDPISTKGSEMGHTENGKHTKNACLTGTTD